MHAKKIFKEVFNNKISTVSLNKGINLSNEIITSTSWKSDLEKKAMLLAKKNKKKITVLFDHWVNYEDRVKINKKLVVFLFFSLDTVAQKTLGSFLKHHQL